MFADMVEAEVEIFARPVEIARRQRSPELARLTTAANGAVIARVLDLSVPL
jgi:hypothetical protein